MSLNYNPSIIYRYIIVWVVIINKFPRFQIVIILYYINSVTSLVTKKKDGDVFPISNV